MDRIVELIYALTGNAVKLSEGTVSNWLGEMHRKAEWTKKNIEKHLLDTLQVNTDGTVVTTVPDKTLQRLEKRYDDLLEYA